MEDSLPSCSSSGGNTAASIAPPGLVPFKPLHHLRDSVLSFADFLLEHLTEWGEVQPPWPPPPPITFLSSDRAIQGRFPHRVASLSVLPVFATPLVRDGSAKLNAGSLSSSEVHPSSHLADTDGASVLSSSNMHCRTGSNFVTSLSPENSSCQNEIRSMMPSPTPSPCPTEPSIQRCSPISEPQAHLLCENQASVDALLTPDVIGASGVPPKTSTSPGFHRGSEHPMETASECPHANLVMSQPCLSMSSQPDDSTHCVPLERPAAFDTTATKLTDAHPICRENAASVTVPRHNTCTMANSNEQPLSAGDGHCEPEQREGNIASGGGQHGSKFKDAEGPTTSHGNHKQEEDLEDGELSEEWTANDVSDSNDNDKSTVQETLLLDECRQQVSQVTQSTPSQVGGQVYMFSINGEAGQIFGLPNGGSSCAADVSKKGGGHLNIQNEVKSMAAHSNVEHVDIKDPKTGKVSNKVAAIKGIVNVKGLASEQGENNLPVAVEGASWTTDAGDGQVSTIEAVAKPKRILTAARKKKKQRAKHRKKILKELASGTRKLRFQLPKEIKKVIKHCEFYMKGRCTKGKDCLFSHDVVPKTKSEKCKYFISRCCLKGDDCPFSHDLSLFPCKFFHTRGYCLDADSCRFSHEPISEEKRQELLKKVEQEEGDHEEGGPARKVSSVGKSPTMSMGYQESQKLMPSVNSQGTLSDMNSQFYNTGRVQESSRGIPVSNIDEVYLASDSTIVTTRTGSSFSCEPSTGKDSFMHARPVDSSGHLFNKDKLLHVSTPWVSKEDDRLTGYQRLGSLSDASVHKSTSTMRDNMMPWLERAKPGENSMPLVGYPFCPGSPGLSRAWDSQTKNKDVMTFVSPDNPRTNGFSTDMPKTLDPKLGASEASLNAVQFMVRHNFVSKNVSDLFKDAMSEDSDRSTTKDDKTAHEPPLNTVQLMSRPKAALGNPSDLWKDVLLGKFGTSVTDLSTSTNKASLNSAHLPSRPSPGVDYSDQWKDNLSRNVVPAAASLQPPFAASRPFSNSSSEKSDMPNPNKRQRLDDLLSQILKG